MLVRLCTQVFFAKYKCSTRFLKKNNQFQEFKLLIQFLILSYLGGGGLNWFPPSVVASSQYLISLSCHDNVRLNTHVTYVFFITNLFSWNRLFMTYQLNVNNNTSLLFSPQDPYTFEPNCQMRVDEFGFFITWKSEGKVVSSLILTCVAFGGLQIRNSLCCKILNFSLRVERKQNCFFISPGHGRFKKPHRGKIHCLWIFTFANANCKTMLFVCLRSGRNVHTCIFLRLSPLCRRARFSSVPSSTASVLAPFPRWENQPKDILFLFLFAHCSRMQRTALLFRQDACLWTNLARLDTSHLFSAVRCNQSGRCSRSWLEAPFCYFAVTLFHGLITDPKSIF